jgi:5-methylcytosine-specific restriction endonuclease McrA
MGEGKRGCRICQRIVGAAYQRKLQAQIRVELNKHKLEVGCSKCGYKEHPAALQFDHIIPREISARRSKRSGLPQSKKELQIFLESDNIEVLCANCHCIKTRENGDYKVRN